VVVEIYIRRVYQSSIQSLALEIVNPHFIHFDSKPVAHHRISIDRTRLLNPMPLYKSPATAPASIANAAGAAVANDAAPPVDEAAPALEATADVRVETLAVPVDDPDAEDEDPLAGEVAREPPTVELPWRRRPPAMPPGWLPLTALPALSLKALRDCEEDGLMAPTIPPWQWMDTEQ